MNTQKTAPDFGEPWRLSSFRNCIYTRDGKLEEIVDSSRNRSLQCVNACAGMSDPAAEIQALRDAVKEARDALEWAIKNMNPPFEWEPFTKANATLSKLQSLA